MMNDKENAPKRKHQIDRPGLKKAGWYTCEALAAELGMTPETVRRWVQRKMLPPPRKFPGFHAWNIDMVHKWLADPEYKKECEAARKDRARYLV